MKTIDKEFRTGNEKYYVDFTQIKRVGNVATYKRVDSNGHEQFETIVIRVAPEQTIVSNGSVFHYPEREQYPSASQWGTYGWTFLTEEGANKKLESLVES